jgi:hypothetical protein
MLHTNLTDTQITLIAGGVVFILAVALMVYYRRSKGLIDEMWAVDTYDAAELRKMCSGGFNAVVEVQGQVSCEAPITAPASKFPCCWCRTRVDREAERVVYDKSGARAERFWRTDYDKTLTTIFRVTDSTGFTLVDPTNAQIDTEDPYTLVTLERESWFDGEVGRSDTGRYRIREEIFVPSGYVYILGQASNCQEGLASDTLIHYPGEGYTDPSHRYYIISRKSEKDLTDTNEISVKVCFWAGIGGFMFAAYCILRIFRLVP